MDTMNFPVKRTLLILGMILLAFGIAYECHASHEAAKLSAQNMKVSRDTLRHIPLKDGTIAAEISSYTLSLKDFKEQVLIRRDSIKRLKERIGNLNRLTNDLRIRLSVKGKIKTPYHDTVIIHEKDTARQRYFSYEDRWLTLKGVLFPDTLSLSYKVNTDIDIASYRKKQGIFKPDVLAVNVTATNPHLEISGMNNYLISHPPKFYETRGFAFAVGLAAGLVIRGK